MRLSCLCILAYLSFQFQCTALAYDSPDADSLTELHSKAESGDISAQHNLAVAYWYNAQPPSHPSLHSNACQKCEFWARKAAGSGDVGSIYLLGCLQFEEGVTQRNPLKGRLFLFFAASRGYKLAQEKYGQLLADGEGGDRNELEGAAFLTVARIPASGLTKSDEDKLIDLEKKLERKGQSALLAKRVDELRKMIQTEQSRPLPGAQNTLTDDEIMERSRTLGGK